MVVVAGSLLLAAMGVLLHVVWRHIDTILFSLPGIDKVIHFVAGGCLWLVVFASQRLVGQISVRNRAIVAVLVTVSIILADEYSQSFSPGRTVDWEDPAAGIAGMCFSIAWAVTIDLRGRVLLFVVALGAASAITRDSYLKDRHFFHGILLERQGQYELALDEYRRALEHPRVTPSAYNNAAWLLAEYLNRDYDQAIAWGLRGVELAPEDANVRDTLAWAYYKAGDLQAARRHSAAAVRLAPDNPIIREHRQTIEAAVKTAAH